MGAEPAPRKPTVIAGSGVNSGGSFTASPSGAEFVLPSRAHLKVAPNTTLRIFPVPQALQLAPGAKTTTWSFSLQSGRVDVDVPRTGRTAVLASIGKLSAVVTVGHTAILADNDEVAISNAEGEVRTLLADHWQTVPVGWLATLDKDNPNATAKPGLAGPTLTGGERMWFAPETVAMHGFRWNAVPGAARYELRLRNLVDGKLVDQRSTEKTNWNDSLDPVEPGKYGLSLRSVDARGIEGSWTPDSEVRVIGVVLPPGGYSTEKAIFMGSGQQVQFTNTTGLEMTYLGAGRYFPAAHGATLYRGTTTVIGFRMPGALDTATARLEPRGVYADVRIGPKRAIWPRDPISIDIQLKSMTGSDIPSFLRVVPTVMVGLDPVDVSFEQNGNTLHALVPPSSKPGPWVLRVDVADQFGVPLGHDFLEVAAQPQAKAPAVRILAPETKPSSPVVTVEPPRPAARPTVASSD